MWTENQIQGLKSQEAKDLAIELQQQLQEKDRAPISPGEVQLQELQYELKLKEAEAEDRRIREAHQLQVKQLELKIEQEKAHVAAAESRAEAVRAEHAALLDRVGTAEESLSVQLERARREHNLRVEQLQTEYQSQQGQLKDEIEQRQQQKAQLVDDIAVLTDIQESAEELGRLREEIESRQKSNQQQLQQLDEEFESLEHEKTKRIKQLQRQQELELAQLETAHKKQLLQENRKAADAILASLGMVAVESQRWEELQQHQQQAQQLEESRLDAVRQEAREELKKEYHITHAEVIDVTDLFYRHQAAARELEALHRQVEKLEGEIQRMRQHIEKEPQRIATAVEAAKVHVQNTIEQSGQR
jgi:hypothetical protein